MSEDLTTLDGLCCAAWDRLETAAKERSGPAHLMTLATSGAEGPAARILVLRAADRLVPEVRFWTNAGSPKVAELTTDPRATAVAWDPEASLQIRLSLRITLAPGPAAVWPKLPEAARVNYIPEPPPGTELATPETRVAAPDLSVFMQLIGEVTALDVLHLAHAPHRRALFTGDHGRWIAP